MPVDSRVIWEETPQKQGKTIVGKLECDFCHNTFERTKFAVKKEDEWGIKERIAEELSQHKHG